MVFDKTIMKVNKELIQNVANVARLNLNEHEMVQFTKDFSEILNSFSILNTANTNNTIPSFQPVDIKNVLREDVPKESLSNEQALKNATHKKDGYFKGPKSI
jgi:aspartyl-tRNA(Asn)/glutamyl-tRNA(Gln) amidotransferase subunit C